MSRRSAGGLAVLVWLWLLVLTGPVYAGGYTLRPSQPTVKYTPILNSCYLLTLLRLRGQRRRAQVYT